MAPLVLVNHGHVALALDDVDLIRAPRTLLRLATHADPRKERLEHLARFTLHLDQPIGGITTGVGGGLVLVLVVEGVFALVATSALVQLQEGVERLAVGAGELTA
jgi:hypothetical protein|tara:strand:+ start:640 stop:954 length:315 start_codon:yes stop_codon:yes gene_type:complete